MKSWRRQALFQGRHCFCPTPTLGGGGPVKEAGTHSPPCPQYLPNIKPHAMHQIVKGSPLLAEDVYVTHSRTQELHQGHSACKCSVLPLRYPAPLVTSSSGVE